MDYTTATQYLFHIFLLRDTSAGNFTTTGGSNAASGAGALNRNTSGTGNTANGSSALFGNTSGGSNTAVGFEALMASTTADFNTAIGAGALGNTCLNLPAGCPASNNTAVGTDAGNGIGSPASGNVTGSNNTFLGAFAGYEGPTDLTNATAIGANSQVTASNALVLGAVGTNVGIGTTHPSATLQLNENDSSNADVLLLGSTGTKGLQLSDTGSLGVDIQSIGAPLFLNFWGGQFTVLNASAASTGYVGIGTRSPDAMLSVNGTADKPGGGSWGTFSDARLKTVGHDFRAGLADVLRLQPRYYRYKPDNALGIADRAVHVGVVAQEVEPVLPEAVSRNDQGYLLVNNDPVLWAMLNAIKEQQALIEKQAAALKAQQAEIAELSSRTQAIEAALADHPSQTVGARSGCSATGPATDRSPVPDRR